LKNEDGTYIRPHGHLPSNMQWDSIRGLWAPEQWEMMKSGNISPSSLSVSSSFCDELSSYQVDDGSRIVRASEVKIFHHSSPMWRSFFQFKKHNRERQFQARTKDKPTGIINGPQLNKSNWGKIEKLMQQQRSNTINTNISTTSSDDGDTHLV